MNYLFDLDGLLINSEEMHLRANSICFSNFGLEFSEDIQRQGIGKKFVEWIKTLPDVTVDGEVLLAERDKIFFELAKSDLSLTKGAKDLLEYTNSRGLVAMVTSSSRSYVDFILEQTGISDYFGLFVAGDMVSKGKPDPEGYIMAARLLNVDRNSCVVFEDAPDGVRAGKGAGMKVVAVPNSYVKGDHAFNTADLLLSSLAEYMESADKFEAD